MSNLTDLPAPTLQGSVTAPSGNAEVTAKTTDAVTFRVGEWDGFTKGDTVKIMGGLNFETVLGSTQVPAPSFLVGTKVRAVDIGVPAKALIGLGPQSVRALWNSSGYLGSKVSTSVAVHVRGGD